MKTNAGVLPDQDKNAKLNARKGRAYPNKEKMMQQGPAAVASADRRDFRTGTGMMFEMLWNNLF
ncbi:hypothetical protein D0C36_19600 [Mucilaginibacter conchicola]|uniref:Uncharacterized protein n=1 Tax=Mucilaginibacter conchicola TaxID=2303333 RepID=A0A372NQE0_9SPHI|nr:hypothetical protein [Mucilaginibacter conchicola]RFZ91149.1 hypothetical protein D0C36_19600 [Mucilaginibacter conchicola]